MQMNRDVKNYNQSVWSSCEIIKYLAGRDWCRLKDISENLEIEQARTHRLLNALIAQGFVQYNSDTRKYKLGFQFYNIVHRMTRDRILNISIPFMEAMADSLNEVVNLGLMDEDKTKMHYIYRLDGNLSLIFGDAPSGIHESALGKCMLAFQPKSIRTDIINKLSYTQYTDHSIMSSHVLINEIESIRKTGYAVDAEEIVEGIYCIGIPLLDSSQQVIAGISVSLTEKPTREKMKEVLSVMRKTAMSISKALSTPQD